jgi:hypothetical protein
MAALRTTFLLFLMHFNFEDNLQIKALGVWFLATLITTSIYIGGIGDQLRFGSEVW